MLYEIIGKMAMLEQTAEEAAELARYERGENPVYKTLDQLRANLVEEISRHRELVKAAEESR